MERNLQRRWWIAGWVVVSVLGLGLSSSFAQNLGELARKERAKRKEAPSREQHVYTNSDLKRGEILTPQDQARFAAAREVLKPSNAPQTAARQPTGSPLDQIPLGDLARRLRTQRLLEGQREMIKAAAVPGVPSGVAAPKISLPPPNRSAPDAILPKKQRAVREPEELSAINKVRVRAGDTLWKLARNYLGEGERWRAIARANPQLSNPNLIHPGEWIHLPHRAAAQPLRSARVRKGDSLWKLAEAHYGAGACWVSIARANPQIANPNFIYPGQQLVIPPACSPIASAASPFALAGNH